MDQYILKSLKKMKKEIPRRLKDLRASCDESIALLTESDGEKREVGNIRKYFEPLRLACESRQPRLMEIGLDAIHFLIEHGFIRSLHSQSVNSDSSNNNNSNSSSNSSSNISSSSSGGSVIETVYENIPIEDVIQCASKCSDEYDELVQLQVIKVLLTAVTSSHCEVNEGNLLLSVRSCFHIHLISKNQVNKTTAKAALTHMLSVINQRMEIHDKDRKTSLTIASPGKSSTNADSESLPQQEKKDVDDDETRSDSITNDNSFVSIYHKDAFLTFRAICKISMKGLHDESGSQFDPIALQNKILSLELIFHVLQHCGPAFQSDNHIIEVVRDYLCVSLLSNCTSQIAQVTGLSLQIFVALLRSFKDHLKSEVEVFITGIFLRILESENSSNDHKLRVLEVFHIICRDPNALLELFINYDCDLEAIDLFRRIVDGFAKIAKNASNTISRSSIDFMSTNGKKSLQDELMVRYMGLEGLVIILQSLKDVSGLSSKAELNSETSNSKLSKIDPTGDITPHDEESVVETSRENVDQENIVEVFDRKQKMQEEIETGILKFNLSPKKGLAYLASLNHIEYTPTAVAKFLIQYQDRLDKSTVGEYLGREREYENGFCTKVLHEYVDSMDFSGMPFDLAIRHFLNGFRLPGEAQKIDRMMEKFAERYYLQNRDTFASADMAFILAFSTIMLQTNLHNPAIKDDKRMTKEQFIKQNKGISSDGEIPDNMLMEIYDRIAAEPIRISHEEKVLRRPKKEESFTVFAISQDKKRKDAFNSERIEMVKAGEALFKQKSKRISQFVRKPNKNDEMYMYGRPMFEVIWATYLGVFSQIMETVDDEATVTMCLIGVETAIHLACRLDISVARDTFINALSKFTTLDTVREMHSKHIACIKTLLDIAISEKDYIDESWKQILQSISQLARLQLFASGLHTDDVFFSDTASTVSSDHSSGDRNKRRLTNPSKYIDRPSSSSSLNMDPFNFFSGPTKAEAVRQVEETNAEMIMREVSPDAIDQIFFNSQYLSEESVWHFVKSLCEVSIQEVNMSSSMNTYRGKDASIESMTPRVFSLQKLVEVADFNMHSRPRIAWANIWNLLANYFASIGVSDNVALSMYAVDSLKQLSIKFLQKEELSNFNFQRVFLKPFEIVINKSKFLEIKDLVLRCIDIMIRACASNIRSGWRSIFTIMEVAASQDVAELSTIAFDIIERLMTNQFDLLIFDFVELMNCLVSFVSGKNTLISMRALNYLSRCADNLAEGKVSPALNLQHISTDSMGISWEKSRNSMRSLNAKDTATVEASVFRLWWPLLLGLSTRVSDSRIPVRVGALKTLGQVLRKYGNIFSTQTWSVIFKGVLFPMMDSAKTDFSQQSTSVFPSENQASISNSNSWIGTMGEPVLSICLEMYFIFKENSNSLSLLSDILTMLEGCICQETEVLAKMALKAMHELLLPASSVPPPVTIESMTLISKKLTSCMIQNLCFDYSEMGILEFCKETPENIRSLIRGCPLYIRRQMKSMKFRDSSGSGDHPLHVNTAYGEGYIAKTFPADPERMLPLRHCIILRWGKLFTSIDSASIITPFNISVPWDQIKSSVMTSMVVSLEIVRVVGDVTNSRSSNFRRDNFYDLLQALETLYWHARSFNSNKRLRFNLYNDKFMRFPDDPNRLPHLLEQEVFSLSKILEISLSLQSLTSNPDLELFAEQWVHRMVKLTCQRYLDLENALASSTTSYDNDEHEAYGAAVLIALQGFIRMNERQFKNCYPWASTLLANMIMCDDVDVRSCVSEIYLKKINRLVPI